MEMRDGVCVLGLDWSNFCGFLADLFLAALSDEIKCQAGGSGERR